MRSLGAEIAAVDPETSRRFGNGVVAKPHTGAAFPNRPFAIRRLLARTTELIRKADVVSLQEVGVFVNVANDFECVRVEGASRCKGAEESDGTPGVLTFRVVPDLPDLLGTPAGDGDLASPRQRLLA